MRSRRLSGQTLVLFALTLMVMTVMVLMTLSFGAKVKSRMELQTTADTTAGSGGAFNSPFPQTLGASAAPAADQTGTRSFNNELDSSNVRVTTASDARVQVGGTRSVAGGDDDLEDLEVERLRLQGLAGQLKKKADELQQRASQLK